MREEADAAASFLPQRGAVVGLAYRMTGSRAAAEDVAQEAFLRWATADRGAVVSPRAWLLKVATRLSLDHLRSARHRRETYVGPWLPEPVLDAPSPEEAHGREQDISVAFLLALQRLTPAERAVFVLHDLFNTPFAELAGLLNRSEAACRKLAGRAREHLDAAEPRQAVTETEAERVAAAFLAAWRDGDEGGLRSLLAAGAVLHTDGGGVRPAALNLIQGADRMIRFFVGVARKAPAPRTPPLYLGRINGLPGFVTLEADGLPQTTALEMRDGQVVAVYVVRNPEKLGGIMSLIPDGAAGRTPRTEAIRLSPGS